MRISVVTPVRNRIEPLKRCIGSVRGQAYGHLEHLIQDGASNDGTVAWLQSQTGIDWRSQADRGMYDAINHGWARATGDVLCWLNSDEQYLPGTLARVSELFQKNPAVDVIWGDVIVVDSQGNAVAARREIPLRRAYLANGFLNAFSCATFFHRRLWDSGVLKLDDRYRYAADLDLILRLISGGCRFLHVAHYFSLFEIDGSNLSTHSRMDVETREIQRRHGGFQGNLMRRAVMLGRYVERAVRGSYQPGAVTYQYAVDELPTYVSRHASRLSGRYAIGDGAAKAQHG